jgi:hypothetical protein
MAAAKSAAAENLEGRIQEIAARRRASNSAASDAEPPSPLPNNVVQLPLWPNAVRGLPNALARSALFNVSNRTARRRNFKQHVIASVQGINIAYTGEELRQDDEDVFLQVLHIARTTPLGDGVEFTAHGMLMELGWGRNSRGYDRLRSCLDRLKATSMTISSESGAKGYAGSLVRKFSWKADDGNARLTKWCVWLEREIVALFGPSMYSHLEWAQRLSLSPLAKWLHAFYMTHREPYGYKVATLHGLCGSETKQLFHFRNSLKESLELLRSIGFLKYWAIDGRTDVVNVTRVKQSELQSLVQ